MKLKIGIQLSLLLLVLGCTKSKTYSDEHPMLQAEEVIKIEFDDPRGSSCDKTLFDEYEITDKKAIKEFVAIINNSEVDGVWKGACFDEIQFTLKDSVIGFSTNGEVFGRSSSGIFYRFPETDVIERFRKK